MWWCLDMLCRPFLSPFPGLKTLLSSNSCRTCILKFSQLLQCGLLRDAGILFKCQPYARPSRHQNTTASTADHVLFYQNIYMPCFRFTFDNTRQLRACNLFAVNFPHQGHSLNLASKSRLQVICIPNFIEINAAVFEIKAFEG